MAGRHQKLRDLLGDRLRELRKGQGLTQEELAERAGVSHKYLGEVERGLANPTVATLANLAAALHIGLPDLFGTLGQSRGAQIPAEVRVKVDSAARLLDEILKWADSPSGPRQHAARRRGNRLIARD